VIRVASIEINRAPVLSLWAAIVAERAGLSEDESLSVGRAVAGLTAQSKGRRLGLYKQPPASETEKLRGMRDDLDARSLEFMHRTIPIIRQGSEIRALSKAKAIEPDSVRRYLDTKFGEQLPLFRDALRALAASMPVETLLATAMDLYATFRPTVPSGAAGWGKRGTFDTGTIDVLRT